MRMDPPPGRRGRANRYSEADLARLLRSTARSSTRGGSPRRSSGARPAAVRTSARLVALVRDAVPAPATGGHPAKPPSGPADRGERRAGRPPRGGAGRSGGAGRPRRIAVLATRSRTGWSSGSSPPGRAAAAAADCQLKASSTRRTCLLTRGGRSRRAGPANPRGFGPGCAPRNGSGRRRSTGGRRRSGVGIGTGTSMSQSNAARVTARPAARPTGRAAAAPPRLRVVPAGHARTRVRLVLLCVALLTGGLVLLLMLNINLSRGAYELYRGQAQLSRLDAAATEDLLAQRARRGGRRARRLGMVPAPMSLRPAGRPGGSQGTRAAPGPSTARPGPHRRPLTGRLRRPRRRPSRAPPRRPRTRRPLCQ
jgi:hypothetical protein